MLKSALAGAMALATISSTLALAGNDDSSWQLQSYPSQQAAAPAQDGMVESKISQFKSALRLTAEQQRHWPRVEAVLRDVISRRQVQEASADGFVQRVSERASAIMLSANSVRRLVSAANPLIKSLDQDQKQVAIALARDMGFGAVAAQFE